MRARYGVVVMRMRNSVHASLREFAPNDMKKLALFLLIFVWLVGWHPDLCNGVVSARTCSYLQKLIAEYIRVDGKLCVIAYIIYKLQKLIFSLLLQGRRLSGIIAPPIPTPGDPEMQDEDLFLPLVIVWSPYLTYPTLFSHKCPSCGCALQHSYWNDGSSSTSQPRLLHDIHNVALLVSATYICENKHRLLAHDECILKCFTAQRMIPFVLLFRTGFTLEFIDTCMSLVTHGLNFYNIESFITERRWETFARQQDMLTLHKTMTGHNTQTSDFWTSQYCKSPSNDLISKCFWQGFCRINKFT